MALVRGIDVSRYQTVTSWRSVYDAGYRYAIVKATERDDYTSSTFFEYTRDARKAGLIVGSYHFARPGHSSASSQAAYYVNRLREAGFKSGRDLPPVLDIEDSGGRGRSSLTDWCLDFVREVDRRLGLKEPWLRCGVYCNRHYLNDRMNGGKVVDGRWLWLALWPSGQDQPTDESQMPAGAAIWQWTDRGRVPGIKENTDLNVVRAEDLRRLAPAHYGGDEEEMPVFRHYGIREPNPIPPVNSQGKPSPRALNFDVEWADPKPEAHALGKSSYARATDGWSEHELSGLRVEGMKPGDNYQVQLAIVHPSREEITWSSVLVEDNATTGNEYISVYRTLKSRRNYRVRWRFIYYGKEKDVKVTRGEWIIKEW